MKKSNATFQNLYNDDLYLIIRQSDFDGNKFLQFVVETPIIFRGANTQIITIDDAATSVECEKFEELYLKTLRIINV